MNLSQINKNRQSTSFDFFNKSTLNPNSQNTMSEINNRLLSKANIRPNSTTNEMSFKAIANRVNGFITSPPYLQLSDSQNNNNNNNNENMFGSQNQFKYETNNDSLNSYPKMNNLQPKTYKPSNQIKNYAAVSGSIFDAYSNVNNTNYNTAANYESLVKEIEIIKNQFDELKSCFISKCKVKSNYSNILILFIINNFVFYFIYNSR
jgi:hypothetical protein